ncbi:hypothetical protein H9Y05_00640 [Crocinitomicaceae bacterium CZZ-1]|uniref:Uncharacterized protein n=1 Tax=Taishania pollutisoli TaxID=2766479 RepID=A0A8J6PFY3_9FLAO|nr:hypothetical protein [Taishania pollutisoli]MBC9810971.1 hypothetical protein [Taishania pollutisoli]MBX2950128.1 hypothetical protein [Crocinitomicaceae bacterium]NGF76609.1 hypothetical protein [Fluviicola sp. SGL-29]
MKTNTISLVRYLAYTLFCFFHFTYLHAQTTFPWSGTYGGTGVNRTFTGVAIGGITMSATIVNSENVWQDGAPLFLATGSSVSGMGCSGIGTDNQGLLLSTDWSTNTTKTITTTITFSHAVGAVRFRLYDVNDDGYGSWNDRVIVTATDNSGNPLQIYNEASCVTGGNGTTAGNGTTTLTYTSADSQGCLCNGNNRVRVGNDASGCDQVKTITIRYQSAVSPSSYNTPKQYIVVSNLIANCAPLPIELVSFTGDTTDRMNILKWQTATEKNNSHFNLERSIDGSNWIHLVTLPGAGTIHYPQEYRYSDTDFEHTVNYYRLKQIDFDGREKSSDIISLDNSLKTKVLDKIVNTMGQLVDETYRGLKIYMYTDGTIVKKME